MKTQFFAGLKFVQEGILSDSVIEVVVRVYELSPSSPCKSVKCK